MEGDLSSLGARRLPRRHTVDTQHAVEVTQPIRVEFKQESVDLLEAVPREQRPRAATVTVLPTARRESRFPSISVTQNAFTKAPLINSLQVLSSENKISLRETSRWTSLLSVSPIPSPETLSASCELTLAANDAVHAMMAHEPTTSNFSSLMLLFLSYLKQQRLNAYASDWNVQSYNALMLVRLLMQGFIEFMTPPILEYFLEGYQTVVTDEADNSDIPKRKLSIVDASSQTPHIFVNEQILQDKRKRSVILLEELIQCLAYAPIQSHMQHPFYLECLHLLTIMFSSPLFQSSAQYTPPYFAGLLDTQTHLAKILAMRLLTNVTERPQPPAKPSYTGLIYGAYSYLFTTKSSDKTAISIIAEKSAHILVLLMCQSSNQSAARFMNVVNGLRDSTVFFGTGPNESPELGAAIKTKLSFSDLFNAITEYSESESMMLLTYCLLRYNWHFRVYALSRTDPESLILPLLKRIHSLQEHKQFTQAYLVLSTLLILTQDNAFIETAQKNTLQQMPAWYVERGFRGITLAEFFVLIVMKLVSNNLLHFKDVMIHAYSIALFVNGVSHLSSLNAMVAQQVVNFFSNVAKKHQKLVVDHSQETELELFVYEDVLSALLEGMNALVMHRTHDMAPLIYAILHKKAVFMLYAQHYRLQPFIDNIKVVLDKLEPALAALNQEERHIDEIYAIIHEQVILAASTTLSFTSLDPIRFEHVDTQNSLNFLLAYTWKTIYHYGLLYWDENHVNLIWELEPDPIPFFLYQRKSIPSQHSPS